MGSAHTWRHPDSSIRNPPLENCIAGKEKHQKACRHSTGRIILLAHALDERPSGRSTGADETGQIVGVLGIDTTEARCVFLQTGMDRRISAAGGDKSIHSSIQVWVTWLWNWLW